MRRSGGVLLSELMVGWWDWEGSVCAGGRRSTAVRGSSIRLGVLKADGLVADLTCASPLFLNSTSSVAGLQAGGLPSYSTSKFAVRGWTKNAAILGAKDKIRVNSLHPGWLTARAI